MKVGYLKQHMNYNTFFTSGSITSHYRKIWCFGFAAKAVSVFVFDFAHLKTLGFKEGETYRSIVTPAELNRKQRHSL